MVMESSSDQGRLLNILYGEVIPQSETYFNQKRTFILNAVTAQSSDNVYASFSARAANIVGDKAIPLLEELYLKINNTRR